MNFTDHSKVRAVIQVMEDADRKRSRNRANINSLFNGDPPYTDDEAADNHIETNVNFLEAAKIAHDARRQFSNAYLKPGNFFSVSLDSGPIHKRSEWGKIITRQINRVMKASLPYVESLRSTHAQVVLHGVGPCWWPNEDAWCPMPIGIGELLVPSKTKVSLENLNHFAIQVDYSYGQLWRMTHGDKVDPGWNQPLVKRVLSALKGDNQSSNDSFNNLKWEEMQESYKANTGFYESDAVPTVKCWVFYFRDEESTGEVWNKRVLLDTSVEEQLPKDPDAGSEAKSDFLFNPGKRNYAGKLGQIIHVQFGDGANVGPFRWHSVRSLGFMLYAVCHLQNRLRSKLMDATFESLLQFFRNVSADDREQLEKINLAHMGVVPAGLEWVPGTERYQVNERLVESAMAQNRQSMSENSSSFVQDVDNGTRQAQTATETMAKVNASAALISGMLVLSYTYESFKYAEICRRFCREKSSDEEVQDFRSSCIKEGVPVDQLDSKRWTIEPERVMGAGNKTVEIAQADRLMQARPLYDPSAQREILHIFTEVNTDDPQLAERLVPSEAMPSNAVHDAQLASATLMMGLPMALKEGVSHIEYVEALLQAMSAVIQKIEANGGMASETEIAGLQNLAGQTIEGQPIPGNGIADHIAIIAQDQNEQQRVKQYSDALGKLMNMVKAYAQRWEEQQQQAQQGTGLTPEAQAKIQSSQILAQTAAKIKEEKAAQTLRHKDVNFAAEQRRKDARTQADLREKLQRQQVDNATQDMKTQAEVLRENSKAEQAPA